MPLPLDSEQYVAMAAGSSVWAFKLRGTIQPLRARQRPSSGGPDGGGLPIVDTDHIETASLMRDVGVLGGQRYAIDEHTFNPTRARVEVGTRVKWMNNGRMPHTIVAQDGSWAKRTIGPAEEDSVLFEKPGTYVYICKEHPWTIGQLIVVATTEDAAGRGGAQTSSYTNEQVQRGKNWYSQSCSSCHRDDLSGGGPAPPLVGQTFMLHWGDRSLADLFGKISTTMPPDNPGSLGPEAYLGIAEFLLQSNGGAKNLPSAGGIQ